MALPADVRAVLSVARTEVRRSWRSLAPERHTTAKYLVVGGLLLLYAGALAVSGYLGVRLLARGEGSVPTVVRAAVGGLLGLTVVIVAPRTVRRNGYPDAGAGLLTATDHRRVAYGLLVGETLRVLAVLALPVTGLLVGASLGARSPLVGLVAGLVVVAAVLAGTTVGFVLGLALKRVAATWAFARRHRTGLALSVSLSLPVGYAVLAARPALSRRVAAVAGGLPTGWPADAALVVAPGGAGIPARGVLGVAGLVAVPVLARPLVGRLAGTVWFGDRPDRGEDPSGGPGRLGTLGAGLGRGPLGRLPRTTRVVAVKQLRRAVRAPFTVQYASVGVFALLAEVQAVVRTGVVPARLPVFVALAGAWAAGTMLALNPLGNEGPVLPATLTTGLDARPFLLGLALASLLVVVPPTVLGVVVVGLLAPVSIGTVLAVAAAVPALCAGAVGVAARVGVRYPRLEATTVGRDRTVVVPSPYAVGAFSLLLVLGAAPAAVAAPDALAGWLGTRLGLSVPTVRVAGLVAGTGLLGLVGGWGWLGAERAIAGWRLE